jgi:hypothetical protein
MLVRSTRECASVSMANLTPASRAAAMCCEWELEEIRPEEGDW